MGEIRSKRGFTQGLVESARDAEVAPQHTESAGERFIKQLVVKQTCTRTTLEDQLSQRKEFVVAELAEDAPSTSLHVQDSSISVEALQAKTGMRREELESLLSEKPNSAISKLFRFALINHCGVSATPSLISQLPDHPLNNIKSLEENLMKNVDKSLEESKIPNGKRKHKKHRKRRKKVVVEQGCELPSCLKKEQSPALGIYSVANIDGEGEGNKKEMIEERTRDLKEWTDKSSKSIKTGQKLETTSDVRVSENVSGSSRSDADKSAKALGVTVEESPRSDRADKATADDNDRAYSSNSSDDGPCLKRPSLWDVKDMKTIEKPVVGCQPPKLFTVRDGRIVEVEPNELN